MPEEHPRGQKSGGSPRPAAQAGERKAVPQPAGHWAPIGFSQRGAAGHRLSNLVKLYYVPIFALRNLLASRVPGMDLTGLRQAELVRKADELPDISEGDVDSLYENSRYGQRLTFYLYLLPGAADELDVEELQSVVDQVVAQERPCRLGEQRACRAVECESCPHQIRLLDEEHWNGFREVRYRYFVAHRFLNENEHPDEVLQSRYGFLWLDPKQGALAILTQDEQVNGVLTRALAQCLQVTPLPVRFPKELLDKHFSIEKAKHLSYYDPSSGVRHCLSGRGLWQRFEQEIAARERQYARPNSLYEEEIAQGVVTGVGVMASKGKIYLTRTLPTSVVRAWARMRLPELMRDARELLSYQPTKGQSLEAVYRMRLPTAGRTAINQIVDALLQTKREDLTSFSLPRSAFDIHGALSGRYFTPYLRTQCGQCEETAELCPECESQDLSFDGQTVTCRQCKATLSDGDRVSLGCMNGHVTVAPKSEAWSIAPNHWFQKRIARIFAEVGKEWDEANDYFHIEGSTLYHLRRDRTNRGALPPVVQNYISNFWDPVEGQVHTGGGNIVVPGTNGGTAQAVPATPVAAAARTNGTMAATPTGTPAANRGSQQAGTAGPGQPAPPPVAAAPKPKEGETDVLRREDIRPTVTYTPTFHGQIFGPVHTGSGNQQVSSLHYGLQPDELNTLFQSLTALVEKQAPPLKKQEALQQVKALKEAIREPKPNVSRMESVWAWFRQHIPQLAGAVTSVILNPIVGRVVEAAGDVAADELRRRFGA